MTKNEEDDAKPPPCPWCHASAVQELTDSTGTADVRWFMCASCARMFYIGWELVKRK